MSSHTSLQKKIMFLAQHYIHIPHRVIIIQLVCLCHIFQLLTFFFCLMTGIYAEKHSNVALSFQRELKKNWIKTTANERNEFNCCAEMSELNNQPHRHFPLSLNHFRRDGKILMQMKPQQKLVMSACRYNCNFSSFFLRK